MYAIRSYYALVGSAPKVFASRLGFGMVVAIFLLHLLVGGSVPLLLGVVLVVLASLEGVFGFCVGCYVYSFLVLPWLRNVEGGVCVVTIAVIALSYVVIFFRCWFLACFCVNDVI